MIHLSLMTRGILLCLVFVPSLSVLAQTPYERDCATLVSQQGSDTDRLQRLFKLDWDYRMHEYPEFATEVGFPGQNDRWTDLSLPAITRRKRELQAPLKTIQGIDRSKLTPQDQLNFDLFKKDKEDALEGSRFGEEYLAISQLEGIQQNSARIVEQSPRN